MRIAAEKILDQMHESVEEVFVTMLSTVAVLIEGDSVEGSVDETDKVDIEAVCEFTGDPSGAIVLRATTAVATGLARRLLMMEQDDLVGLEEVEDALGECANMVAGSLKTRALDPVGEYELGTPVIATKIHTEHPHRFGRQVFELSEGSIAVEIWLSEESQ